MVGVFPYNLYPIFYYFDYDFPHFAEFGHKGFGISHLFLRLNFAFNNH